MNVDISQLQQKDRVAIKTERNIGCHLRAALLRPSILNDHILVVASHLGLGLTRQDLPETVVILKYYKSTICSQILP